jgi:hypothetical protein
MVHNKVRFIRVSYLSKSSIDAGALHKSALPFTSL